MIRCPGLPSSGDDDCPLGGCCRRPMRQYELCAAHAGQVAARERAKGRKVMKV
jgi:hypothetical protein